MRTMGNPVAPASIQFKITRLFMSGTSSAEIDAALQIDFFAKRCRDEGSVMVKVFTPRNG